MKHKMYCIFALESVKKMGGNRGKLASMAGHAFLHSYWDAWFDSENESIKEQQAIAYRESDLAYKITLVVDTVEELKAFQDKYKDICGISLVTDAGLTVFDSPTTVCLGIGPIADDKIGLDLQSLKIFC